MRRRWNKVPPQLSPAIYAICCPRATVGNRRRDTLCLLLPDGSLILRFVPLRFPKGGSRNEPRARTSVRPMALCARAGGARRNLERCTRSISQACCAGQASCIRQEGGCADGCKKGRSKADRSKAG